MRRPPRRFVASTADWLHRLTPLLLAPALAVSGCSAAAHAPTAQPRQVAIAGDSYTGGSAEGGVAASGWPTLLGNELSAQGTPVDIRVAAEGGSGFVQRGTGGGTLGDQVDRVAGVDSDLIVIMGGSNDTSLSPVDALTAAVRDDLDRVERYAPQAKLLVIGPIWPHPDPPDDVLSVRDVVRAEALSRGAVFLDPLAEGWFASDSQLIGADGVHPTDAGHEYLAKRIEPTVARILADDHR